MTLFVPLDVTWPDNVKVIRVGLEGAGLHAIAMCIAKRMETDGVIHRAQLRRYGGSDDLIDALIDEGLLDPIEYGSRVGEDPDRASSFRVHDWHDRNPSQGAIAASRTAKKRAAQEGNHKRWGHSGDVESCAICNSDNTSVLASDRTSESGAIADPKRVRSPESESETEGTSKSDSLFDRWWGQYPRKVGKAKASTAWRNLTNADRDAALGALPAHVSSWRDKDPQYIPHPTTWLQQRRWEDEVAPTSKPYNIVRNGINIAPGVEL